MRLIAISLNKSIAGSCQNCIISRSGPTVFTSNSVIWVGERARSGDTRHKYRILVEKAEEKIAASRHGDRWQAQLKWTLKEQIVRKRSGSICLKDPVVYTSELV